MPDAVAPESQRAVRRVFARGDLCRGADRGGIDTRERQKRTDDAVALGSHAGETREPASACHVEEDGLGLIVTRVTRRDRRRAEVSCDTSQERVAGVARIVLVHRRRVRATHTQRGTDVVGELRDERGVGSRRARTRAVIEVRDVKDKSELFAQLREDETERGRIGAAGNGEHDRTGAQEFVGAREGANGAKDSGLRAVRQRWLGADSNRRPGGYESPALGQLSYPAASARGISFYRRCSTTFSRGSCTAFHMEPGSKFLLSHLVLGPIAAATGGQDVLDVIRASAGQWYAMFRLERPATPAVRAHVAQLLEQCMPLSPSEGPLCLHPSRSVCMIRGALDLGMHREISIPLTFSLRWVATVRGSSVRSISGTL